MSRARVRHAEVRVGDLGADLVFAPERHLVALVQRASAAGAGVPLADLVTERRERMDPASPGVIVCDTSHARDGVLDLPSALRDGAGARSAKKAAEVGDLLVSRLRPYLRQIALVHPDAFDGPPCPLALSTEFYVLTPRNDGDDLAFLLPFLLGAEAQAALAAAQEGGHHPRVPPASLLALRVPRTLVQRRASIGRDVRRALAGHYRASSELRRTLMARPSKTARQRS